MRTITDTKPMLKWFVGSNGNWFADHEPRGRYCISTGPFPIGGTIYHLAINGKSLGGSGTLEQSKHMAERHAMTGRA